MISSANRNCSIFSSSCRIVIYSYIAFPIRTPNKLSRSFLRLDDLLRVHYLLGFLMGEKHVRYIWKWRSFGSTVFPAITYHLNNPLMLLRKKRKDAFIRTMWGVKCNLALHPVIYVLSIRFKISVENFPAYYWIREDITGLYATVRMKKREEQTCISFTTRYLRSHVMTCANISRFTRAQFLDDTRKAEIYNPHV